MTRRIGIFGGSFDPVHLGHLVIASDIHDRLHLDAVHFVLAPRPPHKHLLWAADEDRIAMLEAAIENDPRFILDTREFSRSGPSWSVETVASFAAEFPGAHLFFIMGEDSLADFHTWREPDRLLQLAELAVAARPGFDVHPERLSTFNEQERSRIHPIESPQIEISSTMIRARILSGASIRYLVPDAVATYIARSQPYGSGPLGSQ
jgi:nicotinate-nucleotide adenylyltransferase